VTGVGAVYAADLHLMVWARLENLLRADVSTIHTGNQPIGQFDRSVGAEQTTEYSGLISTYGELWFAASVIANEPLLGLGIGYDKIDLSRTMALNAFAEVVVRWGLVGLVLFVALFLSEKRRYPPAHLFGFIWFVAAYTTANGAISKAEFWAFLTVVLVFERLAHRP
jgi:hypothetical protein